MLMERDDRLLSLHPRGAAIYSVVDIHIHDNIINLRNRAEAARRYGDAHDRPLILVVTDMERAESLKSDGTKDTLFELLKRHAVSDCNTGQRRIACPQNTIIDRDALGKFRAWSRNDPTTNTDTFNVCLFDTHAMRHAQRYSPDKRALCRELSAMLLLHGKARCMRTGELIRSLLCYGEFAFGTCFEHRCSRMRNPDALHKNRNGSGANIAATYAPKNGAGAYGTWGINIGGRAEVANVADRVGNDSANMRFHWNGQGGQPSWLWGGNSPYDAYVWNPSNFNVNHANTANSAGAANTAGRANTAERADRADRAGTANYTSGYSEKAKRADAAGWADGAQRAKSAERADGAGWADNAGHANHADRAGYADKTGYADNAGTVGGKSVEQIRNESSRVAVLSGTINDGETIPLPDGYSEAQCKWLVSMRQRKYDGDATFAFDCYTNGRTVVCHFFVSGAKHTIVRPAIVNYIVIGVK